MNRTAIVAALPRDAQPAALAAALRGERPPKGPTKAERLALDLERLTGIDAVSILDGVKARYPRT